MFILWEETSTKQIFKQTLSIITTVTFCGLPYSILQIHVGLTMKSTRKSVKLLTILVAFSSHFMKRGIHYFTVFILLQKMRDM